MKNIPLKKFWPGIAWFFVVLLLICMPGRKLAKADSWINHIHLDKFVHAGLFGILAFLWIYPIIRSTTTKKWQKIISIAVLASVWGLATEFIQKYVPGRDYDLMDWAADTAGIVLVLIMVKLNWFK
jgi:VanZ family protein